MKPARKQRSAVTPKTTLEVQVAELRRDVDLLGLSGQLAEIRARLSRLEAKQDHS